MRTFLPLPFPRCNGCGESWTTSYHKGCGGELEVEPGSEAVACGKCNSGWQLRDSRFHCSCGAVFSAVEVSDAIDNLVLMVRQLADYLDDRQEQLARIRARDQDSYRAFAQTLIKGATRTASYVLFKVLGRLFP